MRNSIAANRRDTPRNLGFTRVELAAVMVTMGVLLALLFPSLQSAREMTRRTVCLDNLAKIGVALQNHQSLWDVLPPGTVNPQGPIHNIAQGDHMSWMAQLLPYLGENAAYQQIVLAAGAYGEQNAAARAQRFPLFTCPDYSGPIVNGTAPNTYTVSNYAGCHHDVEAPIDVNNHGVLFLNSEIGDQDVPDGLAQTIFAGEKLGDSEDLGWMSGTRTTLRNPGHPLDAIMRCGREMPARDAPPEPSDLYVGGFGAAHPTVCNFLFGDSRAQSINRNIDLTVLRQLGNRADRKPLAFGPGRNGQ